MNADNWTSTVEELDYINNVCRDMQGQVLRMARALDGAHPLKEMLRDLATALESAAEDAGEASSYAEAGDKAEDKS
jgi:hypothetical protein